MGIGFLGTRHKVFISYHHANDQHYRELFEGIFAAQSGGKNSLAELLYGQSHGIFITQSVQIGEINPYLTTDTIRQQIRDEYLRDSTVTIVLVGAQTWQRKHVDWEIGSSIRDTLYNPRSGLLGILLPTYPYLLEKKYDQYTISPRLHYNIECGYAKLYHWSNDPRAVQQWIQEAFDRRLRIEPDNSYPNFINNKSSDGWSE
jgi:hypothetical protein